MNNREIMLHCTKVNHDYMRLPAGKVAGLEALTALYKRIASQSLQCAQAWVQDSPCPKHEPAIDAFWWSVVAWADTFGLCIGVDQKEWGRTFISPHYEFACYIKPLKDALFGGNAPEPLPQVDGSPADIILKLDALWMERVITLTAKWGLLHHLKDKQAMTEAQHLDDELRNADSPAYKAYLESDLAFFHALFKPLPFSEETRNHIDAWLKSAEEETCPR